MLVLLGFAMIAVFMVLIMTKKLTPVLALIIVPTVFGLFAGAGLGIGPMVMDSMKSMTSTAALLMFAEGPVVLARAGNDDWLALLARPDADIGPLLYDLRHHRAALGALL